MHSKKIKLLILAFVTLFLVTRFLALDRDAVNPDAVNWHYRSEQFAVGLKQFQLEKTYQHYHPGVTLMWITGPSVEIAKKLTGQVYTSSNYLYFHTVAKTALIFAQLVLSLIILFLVTKISGFPKALGMLVILSFEPFFVGNSRLYHMDILFTLLLFIGLLCSYIFVKERKYVYVLGAALAMSLSFLTKSVGIGGLLYILVFGELLLWLADGSFAKKYLWVVLGSFILFTFAAWPALWVNGKWVLTNLYQEASRVGVRNGHDQLYFGQQTENPGIFFYPIILLLKVSPFLYLGLLGYVYKLYLIFTKQEQNTIKITQDKKTVGFISYMAVFYIGYFLVMTLAAKKLDRYMLVTFPLLAYLASYGYIYFYEKLNQKKVYLATVACAWAVFVALPIFKLTPYLFTYTSPLFGNATSANKVIGQKPFGVGMPELKSILLARYGEVSFGMLDTKPLKAIYSNSKVRDIRISGAGSYDVLVLAVNETMPDDLVDLFRYDDEMKINGLPYYTMYVKK